MAYTLFASIPLAYSLFAVSIYLHVSDMIKPAKLVQNSNKSTNNHTFLQQIDHIEGKNVQIINDLLQMYTFWSLSSPILL